MSDNKHKNIPTLEDVIQPGSPKSKPASSADDKVKAPAAKSKTKRKIDDRRKEKKAIPEGKEDRRNGARRTIDQRRNQELDELAEKIMQDMMPDLEQHLFMQLRFELQKYVPQILKEYKDKDEE